MARRRAIQATTITTMATTTHHRMEDSRAELSSNHLLARISGEVLMIMRRLRDRRLASGPERGKNAAMTSR